jgi:hypothetical protein
MPGYYDIAQICMNGHLINGSFQKRPQNNKDYCPSCGEKTVTKCSSCNNNIEGVYWKQDYLEGDHPMSSCALPSYCHKCGKPFPWTENKILTAIQIFSEFGNLDEDEKKTIENDIKNIARDIPQSELSAMRIKAIWKKYGKIAYNIVMEFASKTAAEILKNP